MNTPRALRAPALFAMTAIALTAFAGTGHAQEATPRRGVGIGYGAMLTGASGITVGADLGRWHGESLVDLWRHDGSSLEIGARAWYHLHSSTTSDFSLGGGLSLREDSPNGMDRTIFGFDVGFMIRAFVVPNIALSAFGGLGIRTGDVPANEAEVEFDAQPVAALGLTYYFF